ncbi:MAG: hypothetical protein EAZ91_19970 [Cytophagales bacterium]|nr:MAG: hypothetical protein EAZ91_19970 [Cytophagales bacterium]
MAYSDFTLDSIEETFGIKNYSRQLFEPLPPLALSPDLNKALKRARTLPIRSEKARSEWIVAPILVEVLELTNEFFTIYSGDILTADETVGLRGECDFILTKATGTFNINYPILQVVEAKKNDLDIGVPQCAAQLIGAQLFNKKKGVNLPFVYGCVTTGDEWLFMRLSGNELVIDIRKYYLVEIGELLALFVKLIDEFRTAGV